ncbi:hypothetical protein WICPIJ_003051, partial [Wickerhamomyces pijperi]
MYNSGFNGGQQQPLYSQQTGYNQQQPMYQQQTGYQQPLGAQATGYQPQYAGQFQQQQQPLYGQPTGYAQPLQSQPTGYSQPLQSQPTGYIAQQQSQSQSQPTSTLKIPNIRLSFLTALTQQKYEQLFRTAVPSNSQTIPASNARDILLRSGLAAQQLSVIWELSDLNKSGELLFPEFCLALYLVESALQGRELRVLPSVKGEVEGFVDAINFSIGDSEAESKRKTPFDELIGSGVSFGQQQQQMPQGISFGGQPSLQPQMTGYAALQPQRTGFSQPLMPQSTGYLPQTSFTGNNFAMPLQSQSTGFNQTGPPPSTSFGSIMPLQAQVTGFQPLLPQQTGYQPNYQPPALLQAQKTGVGNNTLFQSGLLRPQATGFQNMNQYSNNANNQEFIHDGERQKFYNIFSQYDSKKSGKLDAQTSAEIFRKSGLNRSELEKVWNLINEGNKPYLTREQFALGMWLIYKKLNGNELPLRLPDGLKPRSDVVLDSVKESLKGFGNVNGSGNHSSFGSVYNAKDEEEEVNVSEQPKNVDELTFLKQQLSESQTKLKALQFEINQDKEAESRENKANLQAIDQLKSQIKALPPQSASYHRSLELKSKLNDLTSSQLPQLISNILSTESSITDAKIELYKIQHPSSITGTGPNGTVTAQDIQKAKSKALVNQRMAALTGRQSGVAVPDYEAEQAQYNAYVSQMKEQQKNGQEIVYDVERGIKEIMKGIKLGSDGNSKNEDNKWIYGVGVGEEVGQFIKELRINQQTTASPSASTAGSTYSSARASPVPAPVQSQSPAPTSTHQPSSYSPSPQASAPEPVRSPEDRAAFLKEQAQKRMKERLAKFGIKREFGSNKQSSPQPQSQPVSSTPTPLQSQPQTASPVQEPAPAPAATPKEEKSASLPPVIKAPKPTPPPKPVSRTASMNVQQTHSTHSDDEDEEEKALRAQLEALKIKKQKEKEERMRKLREELKEEEDDEEAEAKQQPVKTYAPAPAPAAVSVPKAAEPVKHHDLNPFGKPPSQSATPTPVAVSSNNPFGKPPQPKQQYFQPNQSKGPSPVAATPINPSLIAQQRKAQRGGDSDSDDSWGDSDKEQDNDEDEDLVNRQGAAKLAGLLFGSAGGMGSQRNSSNSVPQISTPPVQQPKEKAVPIAAPLPVLTKPAEEIPVVTPEPTEAVSSVEQPVNVPAIPIAAPLPTLSTPPPPPPPQAPPAPEVVPVDSFTPPVLAETISAPEPAV